MIYRRGLFLLITVLLLGNAVTAQETREAQEEAARKLITDAFQLKGDGSAASLSKAIEKFEAAKGLCRSLKNVNAEADLFAQIGFLYDELEQYQKAIENYTQSLPLYRVAGDKAGEASVEKLVPTPKTTPERGTRAVLGKIHRLVLRVATAFDAGAETLLIGTNPRPRSHPLWLPVP